MSNGATLDPATRNGPLVVVITGPSAVGKDSVLARLKDVVPGVHVTVTATTRPRRETEVDGVDYYFITPETYARMLANDEFLEHATVYGYGYGIPRAPLRKALADGLDVLMRVDVQGAATLRGQIPGCICIFLAPPSFADLEQRMRGRNLDTPEAIERRLGVARQELERAGECDYIVINAQGRLDETVCRIRAIMAAERSRVGRRPVTL